MSNRIMTDEEVVAVIELKRAFLNFNEWDESFRDYMVGESAKRRNWARDYEAVRRELMESLAAYRGLIKRL